MEALYSTKGLFPFDPHCGKVRDIYPLDDQRLLVVATDRISAFDVVAEDPVPFKGQMLTDLSLFWFNMLKDIVPNHLLSAELDELPSEFQPHRNVLEGRSMIVRRAKVLPIEAVVRGYLAGSGWKEYQESQTICRIPLPAGLQESDRLPKPILTPATKALQGDHDVNISIGSAMELVGMDTYKELQSASLAIYDKASAYALSRGIIIADTKFEFGIIDGKLILIDEVLTPDSSRFWPYHSYIPGRSQESLDKQPVRDYLEQGIGWDKKPPMPKLPKEIIAATTERYKDARRWLVGALG